MAAFSFHPRTHTDVSNNHEVIIEEIKGLIRVYKDGRIERPLTITNVPCTAPPVQEVGVTSKDMIIDPVINLWARLYVPNFSTSNLPLLVYFHGGGFCIGSASWSCYHEFLANLASRAGCIILSLNYRLAPETRLPAAYEDGFNTLMWVKQQALNGSPEHKRWLNRCNFCSLFLAGDSAGAHIAYNVATRIGLFSENITEPLCLKGVILIQPFFGREAQLSSQENISQPANSALTVLASDTYWRLSLPLGANRDHPYCNPMAMGVNKLQALKFPSVLVCISEMDILKEINLEFCTALVSAGKRVEKVVYRGVGHAFQILHNSQFSKVRTQEMMAHLKSFISKHQD